MKSMMMMMKMDLDVITDEEEEDELVGLEEDESTSYHLSGSDAIKQDDILRRQRKYKRGEVFQKDGRASTSSSSTRASSSGGGDTTTTSSSASSSTVKTTIDPETMDNLLISAFQSMVFLPPPMPRLPSPGGSTSLRNIDVSSRRRLDRRTLYHGLLAELGGSHHHHHHDKDDDNKGESTSSTEKKKKKENVVDSMIRRKYLDTETTRTLKGALSLACQPRWRERLMVGSSSSSSSNTNSNVGGTRQSSSVDTSTRLLLV